MSWLLLALRKPQIALTVALVGAAIAAGIYVRDLAADVADAERRVAELIEQRDAAIEAAAEAARRAAAAAESERRAAADLMSRMQAISGADDVCLDAELPSALWEGE